MKNNKGIILSTYVYILLIFFLFILGTMLVVLNNTKLLSNKLKNDTLDNTGNSKVNFSIVLLGSTDLDVLINQEYVDPGYIAQTNTGKTLTAEIQSNVNMTQVGTYLVTYVVSYNGKVKSVTRNVNVIGATTTYLYNSAELYRTFTVFATGNYKIQLWGASGANYSTSYLGGAGAYTEGVISLEKDDVLYVYIGSAGDGITGGYNGGGNGIWVSAYKGHGGGGATDVRFGGKGLKNRIMVAAGGGGTGYHTTPYYSPGGNAGGLVGYAGTSTHSSSNNLANAGGTQVAGGYNSYNASYINITRGSFGIGGSGAGTSTSGKSGGGAGWYGGSGGPEGLQPGGGGSSYISGHTGCVSITDLVAAKCTVTVTSTLPTTQDYKNLDNSCSIHYSGKYFTSTKMIDGAGYNWTNVRDATANTDPMPKPNGETYTSGGHIGDGYAKITYMG